MSMSINGAMNSHIFQWPDPGSKNFLPMWEKVIDASQHAGKHASNLQKMQHHHLAVESFERSPEKLQAMAERLENRIEAVTVHFDEMSTRLNERFERMEARALEAGKEGRAEHIGKISDAANSRLDDALEKTLAHLDERLQRILTMLSESYGDISDDASPSKGPGFSEIA